MSSLAIYLWKGTGDRPAYGPSKSAGTLILQQYARAINPDDMQISIVHPGAIWTKGMEKAGANESSYRFDDGKDSNIRLQAPFPPTHSFIYLYLSSESPSTFHGMGS